MNKFNIIRYLLIFVLSTSIIFPVIRKGHVELGIGLHQPQAQFDKYVDGGICIRALTSVNVSPLVNFDLGAQFLNFRSDSYQDNLTDDFHGYAGPTVEVTNSEQAAILLAGPRVMSPSKRAFIRPYVALKGGIFFFNETMKWEILLDNSDDNPSQTSVIDLKTNLGWMLDVGSHFMIKNGAGVDISLQYCIIPGLEKPVMNYDEDEDGNPMFEDITFSQRIDADYITIHIGLTMPYKNF